jgi:hypothetical protein
MHRKPRHLLFSSSEWVSGARVALSWVARLQTKHILAMSDTKPPKSKKRKHDDEDSSSSHKKKKVRVSACVVVVVAHV